MVTDEPPLCPGEHARREPTKPAVIMAGGSSALSYAELEAESERLAQALWSVGLRPGDRIALLLENRPEYLVVAFAAQRSGLTYVPVNWHLTPDEAGYIVADSGATVLFTSDRLRPLAEQIDGWLTRVKRRVLLDHAAPGWESLDDLYVTDADDGQPPAIEGQWMFYSSGTTGRPKGIVRPIATAPYGTGAAIDALLGSTYGFDDRTVYLSPAPLYHAAPLGWSMGTLRRGGTVVVQGSFDPESTLAAIEHHRITHAQFVPTMFVRMLKLPQEVRERFDLSSLRVVVHAAAPCPREVKAQMLAWWGPIIHEYYGGSEGTGFVAIGPDEWSAHPGSVGRSQRGALHIVDDEGNEVSPGTPGVVWFEDAPPFEYHGDAEKTAAAFNQQGWTTLGDVGYLDDGYLYLTDRATDLIISGGVNVYPQEVERVLLLHDQVLDVGVIGAPDPEFGEQVVAFVQPLEGVTPGDDLAGDLEAFARRQLAPFKCPRLFVFVDELPRLPAGKLLRRRLREHPAVASSEEG